jgi:CDP-diacylglycerol pyrophosphatase
MGLLVLAALPLGSQETPCPEASGLNLALGTVADRCAPMGTCVFARTDKDHQYTLLKDNGANSTAAFLVVSRECAVTGIESTSAILTAPVVLFWEFAWEAARSLEHPSDELTKVLASLKLPANVPVVKWYPLKADWIGLAINAGNYIQMENPITKVLERKDVSRSQDRLHIHIACVNPGVLAELNAYEKSGVDKTHWYYFDPGAYAGTPLSGYFVMETDSLAKHSPFVLMEDPHGTPQTNNPDSRYHALAVIAKNTGPPFYVLDYSIASDGALAAAEKLLDQNCGL